MNNYIDEVIYDQDSYNEQLADGEANVEVITAIPISAVQKQLIEVRLIRMLKSSVTIKLTVDPALLGGVRIVTDKIVIDDSIKRKLFDMKQKINERMFLTD